MSEKTLHELEIMVVELSGKFELLKQVVSQQKERLDFSSATGHKAWEANQRIEGEIGGIKVRQDNQAKDLAITDEKAKDAGKWARDAHVKYDNFNRGVLWVLLAAVVGALIKFAFTGKFI